MTISNFKEMVPWELTVDEAVELALANSDVLQKLGGVVVSSPQGATTLYDQAIAETQGSSVEAALSAFDAQVKSSLFMGRSENSFNNFFQGGGAASTISQTGNYQFELSKPTATGTTFTLRSLTNYNRSNVPTVNDSPAGPNLFGSTYNINNLGEVRQSLLRGNGALVNRIAGPNAVPGQYNGVLIARIRSDISLADFEGAVRNLVRDVENNYWELYFAYRDLDTKIAARESSRGTWENRKLRYDNGVGRPDDEAQARQQYFSFQQQAQNALTGVLNGPLGVLGAERNLRRLLGLLTSDGKIIRPISEPAVAPVAFDWEQSQSSALTRRVEIRRQKWSVRQRELELIASKSLNKWRFDLVGQYGFKGFGDNLFGSRSRPNGSAFDDFVNGDLDDWSDGVELGGAIGNRQGHLAVRNAELNLVRARAVLKEQKRQILHDLNAAFTEVDRSMESLKTSYNSRVAVFEELEPKRKRVNEGQDQVFFLLDAEQRAATAESAVHRAVADYNKALLNYAYTAGGLLSRYNIQLTEGEWSMAAENNAIRKAPRYENRDIKRCDDTSPVSTGTFNQSGRKLGSDVVLGASQDMKLPGAGSGTDPASPPQQNESLKSDAPPALGAKLEDASNRSGFEFAKPSMTAKKYFEKRFKRR